MSEVRRGTAYGVAAYAMWGLFPLFWPLMDPASPLEVLAHRVLWSLVVAAGLLTLTRGTAALRSLARLQVLRLAVAAVLLAINWGTYIYGVNSGQVVETSLGYFINPLLSMSLGVVVLGERMRPAQRVAAGIGALAVAILAWDNDGPPWIALVLATTFACYGLLKKQAGVGAVASLAVETAVVSPLALAYVVVLPLSGTATFAAEGAGHALLLASGGIVTAVPLLAFGAAATRVPLTTVGVLQYIAPVLQLAVGVLALGEPFAGVRALCFGLVWIALAIFTVDLVSARRREAAFVVAPVG